MMYAISMYTIISTLFYLFFKVGQNGVSTQNKITGTSLVHAFFDGSSGYEGSEHCRKKYKVIFSAMVGSFIVRMNQIKKNWTL